MVVSVVMLAVMLMLALAPLCHFKGSRAQGDSGGLLVILAAVRQRELYLPVEAVPPKPSSLSLNKL